MQKIKKEKFPCRVSFYTDLQYSSVEYPELIKLTKTRFSILKLIESLNDPRVMDLSPAEDELSHFLCRLITSTVPWALQWFIAMETKLFRARLATYNLSEIKNFFHTKYLKHARNLIVTTAEVQISHDTKFSLDSAINNVFPDTVPIFVYFTHAPKLIRENKVKLENGYFLLEERNIMEILANEFREHLVDKMASLKMNPHLRNDERFGNLAVDFFAESQKATNQLKSILENSPPCISLIVKRLKKERHLKYNDRQILTRYFKECGLPVNDCIEFLRSNFSCDPARFDREFIYMVRHNYGLEGKRANYSCHSCLQIINMDLCPFTSKSKMGEYLAENNLTDIEEMITEEINKKNYLKGCALLLKYKRKGEEDKMVMSPVTFFESLKIDTSEKSKSEHKV